MKGISLINLTNIDDSTKVFPKINDYTFRSHNLSIDPYIGEFNDIWIKLGLAFRSSIIGRVHFYKIITFEEENEFFQKIQPDYTAFNTFFNFLWFTKDSCVSYKQGLICVKDSPSGYCFSNSISFSKSDGTISVDVFTEEDLKKAIVIHKAYSQVDNDLTSLKRVQTRSPSQTYVRFEENFDHNDLNRIQRAFRFLDLARSNRLLTLKITFYVLLLECLFSANEDRRLTYKVSKRVSCYVGKTADEQNEIFTFIKDCYDVRAKYVHGQALKDNHSTHELLKPISVKLDSIIRNVFIKVLIFNSKEFLFNEKDLSEWLESLVTSSQTPPSTAA
jgi:hypothetical protein